MEVRSKGKLDEYDDTHTYVCLYACTYIHLQVFDAKVEIVVFEQMSMNMKLHLVGGVTT